MSTLRTLQSTDFDHQLSLIEAQVYALNESFNKLKELRNNLKPGTFERPLTRKELSAATGLSLWVIDDLARKGKIKKHYLDSTPKLYLSEVEAAIKKS